MLRESERLRDSHLSRDGQRQPCGELEMNWNRYRLRDGGMGEGRGKRRDGWRE